MKLLLALAVVAAAAQAPEAPTLSDAQRWHVVALMKDIEVAQLRAQLAQKDLEAATSEASRVLRSLQVAGYTLDVGTLTYKPVVPPTEGR